MRYASTDASQATPAPASSAPSAITRAELRSTVRYWCLELKEAGLPPETVLVTVKLFVRDTIVPRYARYADATDDEARSAFVRDASRWCIEAYFESMPHE